VNELLCMELMINPIARQQRLVRAALNDPAIIHHRDQVRIFDGGEAVRKLLWLAHRDIAKKWTMPIPNWPIILSIYP
jgi:transposase-like protein